MKPLILDFAEVPERIDLDNSLLEYSEELNLSILKSTKEVAIEKVYMETETFTKTIGESSDTDNNDDLCRLMDTNTKTAVKTEDPDPDPSVYHALKNLMETTTYTFTQTEETDTDQDNPKLRYLFETRTITEFKGESSDSDE